MLFDLNMLRNICTESYMIIHVFRAECNKFLVLLYPFCNGLTTEIRITVWMAREKNNLNSVVRLMTNSIMDKGFVVIPLRDQNMPV